MLKEKLARETLARKHLKEENNGFNNDFDVYGTPELIDGHPKCIENGNLLCAEDYFCFHQMGSCFTDKVGYCLKKPEACHLAQNNENDLLENAMEQKVCGCDGVTYNTRCEAFMIGMILDYEGECKTD